MYGVSFNVHIIEKQNKSNFTSKIMWKDMLHYNNSCHVIL